VSDDGIGIEPRNIDRIFDMFFTTKGPGKGTGQGLAICRSIVERKHGGRLTVLSTRGLGTTFTIELPRAEHQRLAS
jgi:signal transduction histidine kinase